MVLNALSKKITWHSWLGHPTKQALADLKDKLNFNNKSLTPCEICHKTKKTRESFTTIIHNSKNIGYLIHLDVWGPYRKSSICQIFLTIVDDFSRGPCVNLIKSKEEVFSCISTFLNLI